MKIKGLYMFLLLLFIYSRVENGFAQEAYCSQNTHNPINFGYDSSDKLYQVVETPNGKSMVFGSSYYISSNSFEIAMARFLADGTPDTSFSNDGRQSYLHNQRITCFSGAVDQNNKIYTAGYHAPGNGISSFRACVVRFMDNGDVDTTFGNGGLTPIVSSFRYFIGVHVYPDSTVVAVGATSSNDLVMARYDYNGNPDTSYDNDGYKIFPQSNLSFQSEHSKVLFTENGNVFMLTKKYVGGTTKPFIVKWTSNGQLDTSFNVSGTRLLPYSIPYNFHSLTGVYDEQSNKLILATTNTSGNNAFKMWRLNTNGLTDSTFATDGTFTSTIGAGSLKSYGVVIDAQTRDIIQYGSVINGYSKPALVKCDSNGVVIPTCNGNAIAQMNFGYTYGHYITAAYYNSLNQLLLFGETGMNETGGASDQDFNFYHFNDLCFLNNQTEYESDIDICVDEKIVINSIEYKETGIYYDTLASVTGCDSVNVYNIEVLEVDTGVTIVGTQLQANLSGATYQWLTCPDYIPISGASQENFNPTSNGSYALMVTDNDCIDTSSCYSIKGIGMLELDDIMVWSPNPFDDEIRIYLMLPESVKQIQIFDALGKEIDRKESDFSSEIMFSTGHYNSGIYNIRIETNKGIRTIKQIKSF